MGCGLTVLYFIGDQLLRFFTTLVHQAGSSEVFDGIPTEVLVGFHAGAEEDLFFCVDLDGFVGKEFLCCLVPPEFFAVEGIAFEDVFYDYAIAEEYFVLVLEVFAVFGVHAAFDYDGVSYWFAGFYGVLEEVYMQAAWEFGVGAVGFLISEHVGCAQLAFDLSGFAHEAFDLPAFFGVLFTGACGSHVFVVGAGVATAEEHGGGEDQDGYERSRCRMLRCRTWRCRPWWCWLQRCRMRRCRTRLSFKDCIC